MPMASCVPMLSPIDLAQSVEDAASSRPEQLFIKSLDGRDLTYGALREHSARIAAALAQRGVEAGDRVTVQVEKSLEAVLLYIACLRMGAVYVPINVANTPHEVEHFFMDSRPKVAVVRPQDRHLVEPLAAHAGIHCIETLGAQGDGSLLELAAQCSELRPPWIPSHGDLAAIVYTSGTTGRSKGAMLTRANLASNAAVLASVWRFTRDDVLLHTLPLFHIHGLFAAINTVIASGSGMLLLPKFDAVSTLQHLPYATVFMGVPTYYTRLLHHAALDRESSANIRLFVSGSAPLLAETHREFFERTGHTILERYGMTETLMNTSNPYEGVRLAGAVGKALPGTAIRVSNAQSEAIETQPDVIGVLEVKGPNVFAGYWRDEEKTRKEFTADGWFKTGDLGRIDANGYVHIVGRAKDLVISGGFNVYPKEVEAELDALAGILESAVFGVPHPDFGEGVTAVVVAKPGVTVTEIDIIESIKARLARYKVPKRIILMEELPRNTMGKVQKSALREAFAAIYLSD
jgi:malonyl-CoA/methylmalonyl-CoA synthetase